MEKVSSVPSLNGVTCDGVGGVDQAMAARKHYYNKNFSGLSCLTDNVPSSLCESRWEEETHEDFSKLLAFIGYSVCGGRWYLCSQLPEGYGKWLFPTLNYDCASKQFKHFAKEAGISGCPGDYGLHSFRRVAVTTAVNNDCDEHSVQKQNGSEFEHVGQVCHSGQEVAGIGQQRSFQVEILYIS